MEQPVHYGLRGDLGGDGSGSGLIVPPVVVVVVPDVSGDSGKKIEVADAGVEVGQDEGAGGAFVGAVSPDFPHTRRNVAERAATVSPRAPMLRVAMAAAR